MHNLAIIPARGGSKRILRKNIKDFLGKPIIAYSIKAALESDLFDEVMVSTEDQEIAEIAVQCGASVPFYRSAETSNDFSSTIAVVHEVVLAYKSQFKKDFELVCCIYPTAPLIQIKSLSEGLDLLLLKNFDAVFPVVDFGYPVWRGLEIFEDGKTQMIWPEYKNSRSQDLSKVYHDAGQWYWMNMNQIKDDIFTPNTGSIILTEKEVQDIDNLTDWTLAEMKYKLLNET